MIAKLVKENWFVLAVLAFVLAIVTGIVTIFNTVGDSLAGKEELEEKDQLNTQGARITLSRAQSIAAYLLSEFDAIINTDEQGIIEILRPLNKADFGLVFNAFGNRWYNMTLGESGIPHLTERLNLAQWMNQELTTDELEAIRAANPEISLLF